MSSIRSRSHYRDYGRLLRDGGPSGKALGAPSQRKWTNGVHQISGSHRAVGTPGTGTPTSQDQPSGHLKEEDVKEEGKEEKSGVMSRPGSMVEPLALSAQGVARLLGVSRAHIWKLHSQGKLPSPVRLGRSVRWDRRELEAWLAAGCPPRDRWKRGKGRGG